MWKKGVVLFVLVFMTACASQEGKSPYDGTLVKQYGGEKTKPDAVKQRMIVLVHPHSGERVNATYYENGRYDPETMAKIDRLFRDRRKNESLPIDPELVDYLVDIRSRLGLPPSAVFEILSGYRAPETNGKLREKNGQAAKNSFHLRGWAVDFRIKGVNGRAVAEIAKTMQRGGVSYYPGSNHVHVDLGNIRSWATQ